MRQLFTGLIAAALALGLVLAEPADAKVYKMKPEERAAALKEKKARKAQAKKSKKAAEDAPGGWVEVKGSGAGSAKQSKKAKAEKQKPEKAEKPAKLEKSAKAEKLDKKSKKSKAAETAQASDTKMSDVKEKKGKKTKKERAEEARAAKDAKAAKAEAPGKAAKLSKADKRKSKNRNVSTSEAFRDSGRGTSVRASSTEVRRSGTATPAGPNLDAYSVSRPGYEKGQGTTSTPGATAPGVSVPGSAPATPAAVVPEVRHEVQPGPLDSSTPLGSTPKGGEGRF